jgi:hypothetical protein
MSQTEVTRFLEKQTFVRDTDKVRVTRYPYSLSYRPNSVGDTSNTAPKTRKTCESEGWMAQKLLHFEVLKHNTISYSHNHIILFVTELGRNKTPGISLLERH